MDAARVFGACIDAEASLPFGIVPGLSDNGKVHMDLDDGQLVGCERRPCLHDAPCSDASWRCSQPPTVGMHAADVPAEGRARRVWNGSNKYGDSKL